MLVDFLLAASRLTNSYVSETRGKIGLSELLDFRDHGCAEHVDDLLSIEQRFLSSVLENELQIFSQILRDHLIGLVDDAPGKPLKRKLMLLYEFLHSSRRGYKDLTTFVQLYRLQLKLIASDCHKSLEVESLCNFFELLLDLLCEFSCWNDYQCIWTRIEGIHC